MKSPPRSAATAPPEPYKGKGWKYAGETIIRKEAKEGLNARAFSFPETNHGKKIARLRRASPPRRIRELGVPRLSVLCTGQHLYAQLFTADGSKVLASGLQTVGRTSCPA